MNKSADLYFLEGCGRCSLGGTPQCKVHRYPEVLKLLRAIALESGLTEEAKWGVPCYTYQGKNIAMLSAFNDFAFLSFFKGSLLADDKKILSAAGENSQAGRFAKFTDAKEVSKHKKTLLAYLFEAIELERAGAKVVFKDDYQDVLSTEECALQALTDFAQEHGLYDQTDNPLIKK